MSAPGTSAEILEWFRAHKMEISAAIRDLFPFLYGLRDKNIISEEDFKNWHDWVTANPNDIQRVVYDVLERIQSDPSAIEEIFCSSNLAAYQDLRPLYESLEIGTQEQSLDFQGTTLPVTCGTAEGILHTDIFATGVSRKSIEGPNGKWLTPSQFESEGGRKHWKWWRRSIQCGKTSLDTLIKRGQLPDPPQNSNRTTMMSEHDDVCIVCKKEDSLICCSSCPRCFHEDCHIPKISAEKRNRWKCTFCQCPKPASDRHREEHLVLRWKMRGRTIVKCEFLLLSICCQPKSFLFVDNPATIQNFNAVIKRPMWLKRLAEKLHKEKYNTVGDFVRDMRLMFKNFHKFYKGSDMVEYGRELQAEFENSFREVFSIL
ncbi:nuclear body protein SP140-like protein [Podarcis raffonei]|uniref:nuclear body protein SP140-like protein n=1 Tax=Podarcis raffonei TaxID=65483 RepID=UPI0023297B75|nr:nuclear body protein SP140-like protein [Podarcis raffonei]